MDVSAREHLGRHRVRAYRGVRVFHRSDPADVPVGDGVHQVVAGVLRLQLRQPQLQADSVGADRGPSGGHGPRLRDGRAGPRHVLLGVHTVVGLSGDRVPLVRYRQLLHQEVRVVCRGRRRAHPVPVLGRPDRARRQRMAHRRAHFAQRVPCPAFAV